MCIGYGLLADVIVAVHVAYVSNVVFGQLAIFVGVVRRWQWIRNFWFRVTHLVAISIVAFEAVMNIPCPLTVCEARAYATHDGAETLIATIGVSILLQNAMLLWLVRSRMPSIAPTAIKSSDCGAAHSSRCRISSSSWYPPSPSRCSTHS
ncbi:DUF2784 family protein [Lacticaseibacillus rhamnosus]